MSDAAAGREPVYVFQFDHTYVFKYYFQPNEVFDALSEYYASESYHFEVPRREWDAAADVLATYSYEPRIVDDVEAFVVVKERYAKHAEILKRSVAHWTRRGHNFFLMKDPLAAERAVTEQGATPVAETDFSAGL